MTVTVTVTVHTVTIKVHCINQRSINGEKLVIRVCAKLVTAPLKHPSVTSHCLPCVCVKTSTKGKQQGVMGSKFSETDWSLSTEYNINRSNRRKMIRESKPQQSRLIASLQCLGHMELAVQQRDYYYRQMVRWWLFFGLSWLSLAIGMISRCCHILPGYRPTIGGHCRVTFPTMQGCD